MSKRTLAMLAAGLLLAGAAVADPTYPNRTIRLVVPFPPGGPTDIVARPLAKELSRVLGQTVVVDNRGGAGGSIGADVVSKAAPDGYTLLLGTVGTQAINPSVYKTLPYDPRTDFTAIALTGSAPVAIVVNGSGTYPNLAALITAGRDKSRARPPNYGSAGSGSPGHLSGERFKSQTGATLTHVPYKGSAPAVQDLVGGQIDMMFDPVQSVLPHIKGGRIKALAVSSRQRISVLPDVPTVVEAGYPEYEMTAWWGVLAPAKLPKDIADKLSAAVLEAAKGESFRSLRDLGIEPLTMDSATFGKFIQAEAAKWSKVVKDSGATNN